MLGRYFNTIFEIIIVSVIGSSAMERILSLDVSPFLLIYHRLCLYNQIQCLPPWPTLHNSVVAVIYVTLLLLFPAGGCKAIFHTIVRIKDD